MRQCSHTPGMWAMNILYIYYIIYYVNINNKTTHVLSISVIIHHQYKTTNRDASRTLQTRPLPSCSPPLTTHFLLFGCLATPPAEKDKSAIGITPSKHMINLLRKPYTLFQMDICLFVVLRLSNT